MLLRPLELPSLRPQELAHAIPWELDRYLPFSVEEAEVRHRTPQRSNPRRTEGVVLAGAVHRALAERLCALFESEGVHLEALWSTLTPLAGLAGEAPRQALVHLGSDATLIALFERGELRLQRTLPRSPAPASEEEQREALEALAVDVGRTLRDPSAATEVASLRLSGEPSAVDLLGDLLAHSASTDGAIAFDPAPIAPEELLEACLRPSPILLDFLPHRVVAKRRHQRQARLALALPIALAAAVPAANDQLERHLAPILALQAPAPAAPAPTPGAAGAPLPSGWSLEGLFKAAATASSWQSALAGIDAVLPAGEVALQQLEGTRTGPEALRITLVGEARDAEAISRFLEGLERAGFAAELATQDEGAARRFTLELQRRAPAQGAP